MRLNAKCRPYVHLLRLPDAPQIVWLWGTVIGLSLCSWGLAAQQFPEGTPEQSASSGAVNSRESSEVFEAGELPPPEETTSLFSFGLIGLGILFWGGFRWYQHTPQARRQQRQQALVSIAALDDRYARGALTESRYQQTRQRLKQRAMQLTIITCKND